MEKNRVLNHSLSQSITESPSLLNAPGTEAFAAENLYQYITNIGVDPLRILHYITSRLFKVA